MITVDMKENGRTQEEKVNRKKIREKGQITKGELESRERDARRTEAIVSDERRPQSHSFWPESLGWLARSPLEYS